MKVYENLSNADLIDRLCSYIDCLERWIDQKGGRHFREYARDAFSIPPKDQETMKKESPSPNSASAKKS